MARQNVFIEATPLINKHLSGVGQVVLETLRALDDDEFSKEFRIKIFVPIDEKKNLDKYTFSNIEKIYLPYPHKFLSLFSRMAVAPPLDAMLGKGTYVFPNFRNWNLLSSKSLTYIHDVSFEVYPEYVEPRNLKFLNKYIELWKRRTDKIITVSKAAKDEVVTYLSIPAKDVAVVENTVDSNFYKPQTKEAIEAVKQKYKLENYLLFVGNIEPRKNLENLIKSFESAKMDKPTTLFIVGGDGWLNDKVHTAISAARAKGIDVRKNDKYVPDSDIPALTAGAQALVLPSWHEGYGLPAVQAIACGTAVIASDIPALVEIAKEYPGTTELFKPDDTKKLTAFLEKYANKQKATKTTVIKRQWKDAASELLDEVRTLRGKK